MLVFLPPSEAKCVGGVGAPLRGRFGRDELGRARQRVLTEVTELTRRDPAAAASALAVPAGAVPEATGWNRDLLDSPTMPALLRYSGVVYAALAASTMTEPQRRVALRSVRIFSGGFGYLAGDEHVPAYRVPAAARLPVAGGLAAVWRPVLAAHVARDVEDELVLDLRSTDYAALWAPPPAMREQVVPLRVLTRRTGPTGTTERVVSYNSKYVKGLVVRALVRAATRGRVDDLDRVVAVVESIGYEVRVVRARSGAVSLDVIETSVGPSPVSGP